jgi:hypothetical protein
MIFAEENVELILKGIKTKTRRLQDEEHDTANGFFALCDHMDGVESVERKGRLLWKVGKTYAMKPGRTKKSVGRILLTGIRSEEVGEISTEDAIAEGAQEHSLLALGGDPGKLWTFTVKGKTFRGATPREAFLEGWKDFYPKSDFTEEVWVLTFQREP